MMDAKQLRAYAKKAGMLARVRFDRWCRTDWPYDRPQGASSKVAVAFVSYNTRELTAQLLFSLFRILGRDQLARVVAVDNASVDGSVALLRAFERRGLIDLIANEQQQYHGPGLNQAINHLAGLRARPGTEPFDHIWILDSDAFVLRRDAYRAARDFLAEERAAAVGQFQYAELPEGYAHVSSLLLEPSKAWRGSALPFANSGTPGRPFHVSVRRLGMKIGDFPFRAENYVLHLGRGTVKTVVERGDSGNQHYREAKKHERTVYHYHGTPDGEALYAEFLSAFGRETASYEPEDVVRSCEATTLVSLDAVRDRGSS